MGILHVEPVAIHRIHSLGSVHFIQHSALKAPGTVLADPAERLIKAEGRKILNFSLHLKLDCPKTWLEYS